MIKKSVSLGAMLCAAVAAQAEIATSQAQIKAPEPNVMRTEANSPVVKEVRLETQFVVCGGGLSGMCAAISAARRGVKVVLVQDRPVLGGNASSEMRMGIMGAAGDENKEAGILEELQLRNFYYNPLRRYTLWDDVMYSTVIEEPNITLLLNTSVDGVEMNGGRIAAVKAWNSNAYTRYVIAGELFADCTGDGILRLSGAKFRHGRELPSEFGEDFQQGGGDGRTMGNSILLQLRKTKEDHPFHAPAWAYKFTDEDFVNDAQPKEKDRHYSYKRLYPDNNNFWWIEFGGNFDTIGDANEIQLELKKIAYGVWDYMKNHPDGRCKGYDLDWIGSLPGKRESVRFIGPRIMTQHDVMSGGHFEDVVAYGGWTLDDHHPDAFWKQGHLSQHHRCPSPFGILMFAGRDISVTHMALSATRVMATCAMIGQAVGTAASVAFRHGGVMPAEVRAKHIAELQADLEDDDCMLPFRWRKVNELTRSAKTVAENEPLRSGIDRWTSKDAENGVWVEPGAETMAYEWDSPRRISGARIIFDSVMKGTTKRMTKLEAEHGRVKMPAPLAKRFRVEARVEGEWKTVYSDDLNILRLRKVSFDSVEADALRLVVVEAWGGGKAHVFAFDALGFSSPALPFLPQQVKTDAELNDSAAMNATEASSAGGENGGVRVVFIGNSITLHNPYPSIGWTNTWGMAASAEDLGENVSNLDGDDDREAYHAAFGKLVGAFFKEGRRPKTAIRGVFWPNAAKDAEMARVADGLGIPFVHLSSASVAEGV